MFGLNLDALGGALERAQSGELPESRESVADCAVHVLMALVEVYLLEQGRLGVELEHLARALERDDDPTVQGLSLMNRMQIRMALSHLQSQKETIRAQVQPTE